MNRPFLSKLAQVLLYEGYILYPYRPSVKNAQRFTFGSVFPEAWTAREPSDAAAIQSETLIEGPPAADVEIALRFLHLQNRTPLSPSAPAMPWQESAEREVAVAGITVASLCQSPVRKDFSFPRVHKTEPLNPENPSLVNREQFAVTGTLEISATPLAENLTRLTVRICNTTVETALPNRDAALLHAFISTHLLLGVAGGEFVSLTDPPKHLDAHAAACKNVGTWPILVGTAPARDTLLSSPIILPDYPELAPESPGDLFDSTEIDEILTLRILTLTDDEKRDAAANDDRIKSLLARTENLARAQMANLHGAFRHPAESPTQPTPIDDWTPFDPDLEEQTRIHFVTTPAGDTVKTGDKVRLRPGKSADILDLALAGKIATVIRIEQDLENNIHVAVTVDDDPGSDLGRDGKIAHRFFFSLSEIETLVSESNTAEAKH